MRREETQVHVTQPSGMGQFQQLGFENTGRVGNVGLEGILVIPTAG
jgi:hypothetical protein